MAFAASLLKRPVLTIIVTTFAWSTQSFAQTKRSNTELPKKEVTSQMSTGGSPLRFNTDSEPVNSDTRKTLNFKAGDASSPNPPKPEEMDFSLPEDAPFKTYIGYPKFMIGPTLAQNQLGAVYSYGAQDYNFSYSSLDYGFIARMQATPQFRTEIEYNHSSVSVEAKTLTSIIIDESETTLDTYFLKNSYCLISNVSFFQRFCGGFDVGMDVYPVLRYTGGTHIGISKTTDIILGLNIAYQHSFNDRFVLRTVGGYNYGTGIGNQGYTTSVRNASYYLRLTPEYTLARRHTLLGNFEYKARQAELEGRVSDTLTDRWETDSSNLIFGLGYLFTF